MKTSLNVENELFSSAKKEAAIQGKSLSEVISFWAKVGRDTLRKKNKEKKTFTPVDLGEPLIDISNRKDWMEELDR